MEMKRRGVAVNTYLMNYPLWVKAGVYLGSLLGHRKDAPVPGVLLDSLMQKFPSIARAGCFLQPVLQGCNLIHVLL